VDQALASGKIYEGDGFNYIKESFENGTLHLIGLLSDGGVHSRLDQLQVCKVFLDLWSVKLQKWLRMLSLPQDLLSFFWLCPATSERC